MENTEVLLSQEDYFMDNDGNGCCTWIGCEHGTFSTSQRCQICFENRPIQKEKTKIEKFFIVVFSPIYFIGWLATGIFVGIVFLFKEGAGIFVGLVMLGWIVGAIYHFFFTFIPFLFNLFF